MDKLFVWWISFPSVSWASADTSCDQLGTSRSVSVGGAPSAAVRPWESTVQNVQSLLGRFHQSSNFRIAVVPRVAGPLEWARPGNL